MQWCIGKKGQGAGKRAEADDVGLKLLDYLKRPEGKTLEFKRDLSSPDGVLRTITAFANTAGGTVLIGVEDQAKDIRGVAKPLDMEERLANLISDRIQPRLVPELEIIPWRRTHILVVKVHPSSVRPHAVKLRRSDHRSHWWTDVRRIPSLHNLIHPATI